MKKDENLIEKWDDEAKKLPELTSDKIYECKQCGKKFTLLESKGDIDSWGIEINCPECGEMVAFEPLGHSASE